MSEPETHSWRTAYRLAVLEPDRVKLSGRIDSALKAIEERLRQPIEIGSPDNKRLRAPRKRLQFSK
jgi:hypothetical protein